MLQAFKDQKYVIFEATSLGILIDEERHFLKRDQEEIKVFSVLRQGTYDMEWQ